MNQFNVELSMVALPSNRVNENVVRCCRDYGVGIIAVDPRAITTVLGASLVDPDVSLSRKTYDQLTVFNARGGERVSTLVRGSDENGISTYAGVR